MKILFVIFLFVTTFSYTQQQVWTAFFNEYENLTGFKDVNGNVVIEPKFAIVAAQKFDKVIAVMEEEKNIWNSYYLLKNGRKFGVDSIFISADNWLACESEGFIEFKDRQKDRVGMFNQYGKVAIPAVYNTLTQFRNGMSIGLKNATKVQLDEYEGWRGGTEYLIDTTNRILVEDFHYDKMEMIDFYSLKLEDEPSNDTCRVSFKGINGKYYTFFDNEKLFKKWLFSEFLSDLSKEKLVEQSYQKIAFWSENEWVSQKQTQFITDNYEILVRNFSALLKKDVDYFIYPEEWIAPSLNLYDESNSYFDNCNQLNSSKYPLMEVIITHKIQDISYQDHFDFLKTEQGFKLISVSFGKN